MVFILTSLAPTPITYTCHPGTLPSGSPDELPDDLLGPLNCAMGTVTTGLMRAEAREGNYVVIQGAGGLGLHATAMAKDMGADRVIVLDRLESRLQLAEEFGADYTINIEEFNTPETRVERVMELTNGRGTDVVMELVGRAELLAEGIDMLSNGGTFVEIGDIVRGREVSIDPSKLLAGKNIVGSLMYRPSLLPTLLDFLVRNQHKLPFHKIVSHKFPLAEVNEAFPQAELECPPNGDYPGHARALGRAFQDCRIKVDVDPEEKQMKFGLMY